MIRIHAWLLADTEANECHNYFTCRTRLGFRIRLLYCRLFYDYIEIE